jgi:hypothetical protein
MAEPITMAVLGAWVGTSALAGFIGGRTDYIACSALAQLRARFTEPKNHDIAKGLVKALGRSLVDFFQTLDRHVQEGGHKHICGVMTRVAKEVMSTSLEDTGEPPLHDIQESMLTLLSGKQNVRTIELVENLTTSVWSWLSLKAKLGFPDKHLELFDQVHDAFARGRSDVLPWSEYFRKHLAEIVKTENRFKAILDTSMLAELHEKMNWYDQVVSCLLDPGLEQTLWDHADRTRMTIHLLRDGIGLAGVPKEADRVIIKRNQKFRLSVITEKRGEGLLLQKANGSWYVTTIKTANEDPREQRIVSVDGNQIELPVDSYLQELDDDFGFREFIFVLADNLLEIDFLVRRNRSTALSVGDAYKLAAFVDDRAASIDVLVAECFFIRD